MMIDRTHELPIMRQAAVLGLSRASVYYTPRAVPDADVAVMRRLDALHLELPFAGSRMLRDLLRDEGIAIGRDDVRTLMARMRITAIYRRPRTSQRHPAHAVFPYLLRSLVVDRPNQVWATDIAYLPMARWFVFVCAIMDWATRKVLAWRISTTLTTDFRIDALEEALHRYGAPEIFNTDLGAQFTSAAFIGVLRAHNIQISMDGKGCWRDNVFVERLWRSVKYEEVYLHAYETVSDVRAGLTRYFTFFNERRPHQALGSLTPDVMYFQDASKHTAVSSRGRAPKKAA
jgi:putative transposase